MRLPSLIALLSLSVAATALAQFPVYAGPKFERTEVAPGVHTFVFDNPLGQAVDGTATVIINDADVVVVDAQNTPWATRNVLAEIRKLTNKPVRYVINTHFHGDHWQGNQVYADAFPGVEFVAHANTLTDIVERSLPNLDRNRLERVPQLAKEYEEAYLSGRRRDGQPMSADDSLFMREQTAMLRWLVPAVKEIRVVKPTLIVTDSLVLHRGDRTIVVRYLGRGNTRGDLTVWLPKEQVLVMGDLLVNPVPYSFGSYLGEWIETLGRARALPAAVIVPGHGALQRDHEYLDLVVALLRSTLEQAKNAVARGMDLEATRKAVDMEALKQRFTGGNPAKGRAFDAYFKGPSVERAWREARGVLDRP
jgi:glyoxylase-like metal-dependent hydrolase (beta-lactamase superfamily II)